MPGRPALVVLLLAGAFLSRADQGLDPPPADHLARLRREAAVLKAETERLGGEEQAILAGLAAATARRDLAAAEAALAAARLQALEREGARLAAAAGLAARREAQSLQALAARLRALERRGPAAGLLAVAAAPDPGAALAALRTVADRVRLDRAVVLSARRTRQQAAAARTRLAAHRQEQAAAQAAAATARAAAAAAVRRQGERLDAIRVRESLYRQADAEYERAATEMDAFLAGRRSDPPAGVDPRALRGTLPWPAKGPVVAAFGPRRHPRFGTLLPHNGLDIGAPAGGPVAAVAAGKVVYADWFQGYGRTVIVDHGSGVMTVSAHLDRVAVSVGEEVTRGQELGTVGATGTLEGPRLYFELRVDGRPEPPMAWLAPP